jgi:hypothetical protein
MKLELLDYTPDIETLVAVAMLTTTSGSKPSQLFIDLRDQDDKVAEIVGRLELQHGSILEHNRLIWRLESRKSDIMDIMLKCKFFNFSKISEDLWILSSNLRTLIEYSQNNEDEFAELLLESVRGISPEIYRFALKKRV